MIDDYVLMPKVETINKESLKVILENRCSEK